jgi:hypothetical protein
VTERVTAPAGSDSVMDRMIGCILLGLMLQACAPSTIMDRDGAYFSSLFGEQSGTCNELRKSLKAEIDEIKSAQKKADDDFIAEQSAPAPESAPRGPVRKGSETAALREVAKKTKHAEQMNAVLQQRRCRTVNIEQALK